jgi:Zn-dependent protease
MTLAFRLGAIPVRIHAGFLLLAGLLGLTLQSTPLGVALCTVALLVAVLVHELAHAVTARTFGVDAQVDMTPFRPGVDRALRQLSTVGRVSVALAGPLAGTAVAAVATLALHRHPIERPGLAESARYFVWINWAWAVINLLPILPFDGGYVLLAIADRSTRGRGEQPIRLVSIGLSLLFAIAALFAHAAFPALLFGLLGLQNARGLRARDADQRETLARVYVHAAYDAAERDEPSTAIHHCLTALRLSSEVTTRKDALRLLAYGYATTDAWRPLLRLLESGGAQAMEDAELATYEEAARELGRTEDAKRIAMLRWPQPAPSS